MTGPFDDCDFHDELDRQLAAAEALDGLEEDVTSWEADFLENILRQLRRGNSLTPNQLASLKQMCERYKVDY